MHNGSRIMPVAAVIRMDWRTYCCALDLSLPSAYGTDSSWNRFISFIVCVLHFLPQVSVCIQSVFSYREESASIRIRYYTIMVLSLHCSYASLYWCGTAPYCSPIEFSTSWMSVILHIEDDFALYNLSIFPVPRIFSQFTLVFTLQFC